MGQQRKGKRKKKEVLRARLSGRPSSELRPQYKSRRDRQTMKPEMGQQGKGKRKQESCRGPDGLRRCPERRGSLSASERKARRTQDVRQKGAEDETVWTCFHGGSFWSVDSTQRKRRM